MSAWLIRKRAATSLGVLAALALLLTFASQIVATTQAAYSWGDGALLELYTVHASRGFWPFGPYSHFGWHHPGPLLFYLLAPIYTLSGAHAFALNTGAAAINVAAAGIVAWAAARWMRPVAGSVMLLLLAAYLWRVSAIAISYWNPHLLVLPIGAAVVLCAGVAAGRAALLPLLVFTGSFLAQTHVAMVPTVAALTALAIGGLFINGDRTPAAPPRRAMFWIGIAAAVALLLWLPPLLEEAAHRPGNVSMLARFFTEPYPPQPWRVALAAWGDATSSLFARALHVPTGAPLEPGTGVAMPLLAMVQLLLLAAAWHDARRRGDRMHAALALTCIVVSLVALWSIVRVRGQIGEYMVFWISLTGALSWAAVAAAAIEYVGPGLSRPLIGRHVPAWLAAAVLLAFTAAATRHLADHVRQPEAASRRIATLSDAALTYLRTSGAAHPSLRLSPAVWPEGAGVVVRLYKLGIAASVKPDQVSFFGTPLAPDGREDVALYIVDAAGHAERTTHADDLLLAQEGAIYLHAAPLPGAQATSGPEGH